MSSWVETRGKFKNRPCFYYTKIVVLTELFSDVLSYKKHSGMPSVYSHNYGIVYQNRQQEFQSQRTFVTESTLQEGLM